MARLADAGFEDSDSDNERVSSLLALDVKWLSWETKTGATWRIEETNRRLEIEAEQSASKRVHASKKCEDRTALVVATRAEMNARQIAEFDASLALPPRSSGKL
mmetsp:Transcript_2598/g.7629  ORF Transcript_2598/g.7629 Transcript_2598/m.7629 type:complete len:104 (+) Transcript_2598:256-567(+)